MDRDWFTAGIAAFLVLTCLYAVLVAQQLLLWFFLVLIGFLLHLVVRLVRAVETIAENTARPETDDADG
jgi:multisubunit Na+/H+ antiporter MnhE subunit